MPTIDTKDLGYAPSVTNRQVCEMRKADKTRNYSNSSTILCNIQNCPYGNAGVMVETEDGDLAYICDTGGRVSQIGLIPNTNNVETLTEEDLLTI